MELAIRSLKTAVGHRAGLVLCGDVDLVHIAHGLHRRGSDDRPFVVRDPRRANRSASVRSSANCTSGVAALSPDAAAA
jgi:hypothetical protein